MEEHGTRRIGLGRKLLFAAVSTAALLATLEFGLRLAGYGEAVLTERVEELGWHFVPSQDGETRNGLPVHVNAHGLRDEEFPREKPPGERRVLLLGDSITFGVDVAQEETFAWRLRDALDRRGRPNVRPMNSGVPGYDLRQYLLWLERYGFALSPDLVVVCLYQNDIEISRRPTPYHDFPGRSLVRRTATYQAFERFVHARMLPEEVDEESEARDELERLLDAYVGKEVIDPDLPLWRRKVALARELLVRLDRRCREEGTRLAVLLIPAFANTAAPDEPIKLFEKLAETLDDVGAPYRSLLAPLAERHPDVWLPHDSGHLSVLGHERVAEAAAEWIVARGLLPVSEG
ncbi:MAG: SGNH/GDSL hydrolase family protein [Planctomycetota bacterium JB042]